MKTYSEIAFIAAALAFAGCVPKPTPEAQAAPALTAAAPAPATAPESASPPRPGCPQNFAAFDDNGDQRVSRQEFLERPHAHPDPEAIFQARDGDADGSLTSDEFCSGWHGPTAAGPGRGPAGSAGMGRGGCPGPGTGPCAGPGMAMDPGAGPGMAMGPGAGRGMGRGPGGGPHCEAHFARFDANADGNVSEAEFAALPHPHGAPQALFAARDQNHDGLLTKTEFCVPWSPPDPPTAPHPPGPK
jgi:Ca2+-binding EF-hand superfamily protein